MTKPLKLDTTLRERRRIIRLLDFLKRDDLTGDQMERIGRRLQKSGRRALQPLVRKLWQEQNGTAIYRYTCMLDFFDDSGWLDQLVQITLKRKDLEEDGRLALLDALQDYGIDVTSPPFAAMSGYGAGSLEGFIGDCLKDGDRGQVRFMDVFLDAGEEVREHMIRNLAEANSAEAVALLEILTAFERTEVVREACLALGRTRNGYALHVLQKAEQRYGSDDDLVGLIRRSIRRLTFMGVREPQELPHSHQSPLPFHAILAGPIDIYGSRSLWFAWHLDDGGYAAMLLLIGEADGLLNALSYRMKDLREYESVLRDMAAGELLEEVGPGYGLALLRDALYYSRERGSFLPPDFYVDMRLFSPDAIQPEGYVPRFSLDHLEGIVERIPALVASSNELLDCPGLEGWLLSEPVVYDVAERVNLLESRGGVPEDELEAEVASLCEELIAPRRAELVKRLLLTADYMHQTNCAENLVQHTLATALSLVGGFLPEVRHPFIRRLILDSIETARQALAEGYDLRLEDEYNDD